MSPEALPIVSRLLVGKCRDRQRLCFKIVDNEHIFKAEIRDHPLRPHHPGAVGQGISSAVDRSAQRQDHAAPRLYGGSCRAHPFWIASSIVS